MPSPSLRFGISGCGRRGAQALLDAKAQTDGLPHATHDSDPKAAAALAAQHGLVACATFDDLLHSGIDYVVLAGPFGERERQVEAAAAQGVHCLLHAPIAPDATTAARMLATCESAGVKLGVAVDFQKEPAMEQLRRMVADDWLGAPMLITAICADDRTLRQPPHDSHWLRREANAHGAPLALFASEALHLAVWLCEREPISATGLATSGLTRLPQESASMSVALRGGAVCTFACSHSTRGETFSLLGTDGAALIAPDRLWLRGRKPFTGDSFAYETAGSEIAIPRSRLACPLAPHFELHGRFARWIDDRDDFPCPGDQAVRDMRAISAAQRAIDERRAVDAL